MANVQIAFQDNDQARYIVAAIEEDNPTAVVHYEPALIRVENDNAIQINRETVEAQSGAEWEVQSIHVNLVTIVGHIDEDDDYFRIQWGS